VTLAGARPGLGQAAEAVVVALARSGDDAAFGELVRRRQAPLRSLLRRLCRDAALADDLAQEALLQAWQTLPSLRSPAAFGAWLRRLAVNTWLQHLRRRPERTAAPAPGTDSPPPLVSSAPGDPSPRLDLDAALAQLAPLCRTCVVLAYQEGMSHDEIAATTGLPLGTVKSHIRRGSGQLRARLQAYAPSPGGPLPAEAGTPVTGACA